MEKITKKVSKIMYDMMVVVSVLCILWLILSIVDTNMHNMSDRNYASWNMFSLMLKYLL